MDVPKVEVFVPAIIPYAKNRTARETALRVQKLQSIWLTLIGSLTFPPALLLSLVSLYGLFTDSDPDNPFFILFMASFLLLLLGLLSFVLGVPRIGGANSRYMRKHPDILANAAKLDAEAARRFASFFQIDRLEDVLIVYTYDVNNWDYRICFELRDGRRLEQLISFSNPLRSAPSKDDVLADVSHFCPYARIGRTPENLQYLDAMRAAYRQQNANYR